MKSLEGGRFQTTDSNGQIIEYSATRKGKRQEARGKSLLQKRFSLYQCPNFNA
ncbi:MAG: hypothetical protein F6K50_46220 [Moorea sp. SIO3I7]|uniref:hypothetical protein n=1 Tax=unclassified Moorena TaxID=2683338 RepID=UPI0013B77D33|nr:MULTISPECIES: hypothetical protein [unclassified Moorena]NEO02488.1 hypothetical protein [Moorena sp. SIO3I7]NEO42739.1 hypothetical protein [Moorena sp. SIO4A3]NEO61221.1 hypothetical protein [Moorena sp. SIO4G2]NEQ85142.1 hypothetical protein [Moorena sp. SIO2I5]NEO14466.1 hypothetical protein [Moorena sp. SIO3E8]